VDKRRKRLRARLFLGVALVATGLSLIAYAFHFGFFENLERQSIDMRFSFRGSQGPPKDVAEVLIDATTFSDLPNVQWPYPRTLHAKVIDRICAGRPAAIAMDIQFSEYSSVKADNALGTAAYNCHGKVVFATTEVSNNGQPNLIFDAGGLKAMGARPGNGLFPTDPNDAIRQMDYSIQGLKTLAIQSTEVATGKAITLGTMGGSRQWIDFAGPTGTVRAYSYSHVLRGQVPPRAFTGKVVVIGAAVPSLQDVADIHPTSAGSNMPGPEIQANATETALRGFPLRSIGTVWDVVLIVCLGCVVPFASIRARPLIAVGTGLLFAAIFIPGVLIFAFDSGRVASFVYPLSALILATVGSIAVHYVVTAFEKERVRDVFSRFVPETVVDQVLASAGGDLRLGGREIVGTVMFSDLRGFTSSSEFMPADGVIRVLNHYLHEMSEAILRHGGTLLCYMGDGIYALFGAPIDQDDHADRALAAAREMLTERLPAFNEFMREQELGDGYFMGVGLNTGPVMTGNVGHERRMDYTAVGDVVNTASRIEGMTKETPYSVLIAESTVESLRNPPEDIVFYEEQSVRGRRERLKLYALDIKKPEKAAAPAVIEPAPDPPAKPAPEPAV
jgi:adenylate cyclase